MTTRSKTIALALATLALLPLAGCGQSTDESGNAVAGQSTISAMQSDSDLSDVSAAFSQTKLDGIFDGPAPYTVLAPRNSAFAVVDAANADLPDEERAPVLASILRDHILPGAITPDDIRTSLEGGDTPSMKTMGGSTVTFSKDGDKLFVTNGANKAALGEKATRTDNGVIIPVDALLRTTGPASE